MALTKQPQYLAPIAQPWKGLSFPVAGKGAAAILVPGGRDMVFQDTNAVPTVFTVTATRTVSPSGVALSWSGDGYYETAIGSFPVEFAMLVVIGGFEAGVAVSICGGRNNNSAAYNSQLAINASGFYELYDNATLRATGVSAAVPGDVVVIVRSANGTVATVYTPREIITSGVVGQVASNVFRFGGTGRGFTGSKTIALFAGFSKPMNATAALSLVGNPWQIFQAPRRVLFAPPAAGDVTGTVAYTNAADTSTATGTTAIIGVSAYTNANDASAASGTTTVTGTSATTNADDASAASGAVGSDITGSSATTNADDAGDAAGTTTVHGTLARTNANDIPTASGTTSIVGTVAYSNANDIGAASGVADAITGTADCANANDTCAAQGVGALSQDASGGFFELPRMKRTRSIEEERERLGIIPKKVKRIIKAVAAASVQEVKTDDQAERQLAQRLAAQDIEAQARFAEFMRAERDRLLSRDIEIALRIKAKQEADDEDEREVEMLLM